MFAHLRGSKTELPPADNVDRPIGLMAGWGELPFAVARALREQGRRVAGIGVRDHADPRLADLCDHFDWMGIGGIGRAIRCFRRWGVTQAMMAGKIHKVLLFQPRWWLKHRPDWKTIRAFSPHFLTGTRDGKDDSLLHTVVEAFARDGITLEPPTTFAPELLVKPGSIAGKSLSSKLQRDARFGWELARQMGRLDIGQTVCVKNQAVIAVEAIEGTDACIRRAGELCSSGGFTMVKVAKPQQDMRFDVPTVGMKTLQSLSEAGGRTLVIEANRTILLDQERFCQEAARLKISVVALEENRFVEAAA
jgi:DUF1009 family protein